MFAAVLDGPNVHFGDKASVKTELKISMTRDFSHCSALAITHHTKAIPEMFKIKQLMQEIGSDFRNSYQKMMEYRMLFRSLNDDIVKFEICPVIRWTYLMKTGLRSSSMLSSSTLTVQTDTLSEVPRRMRKLRQDSNH